jgi:hypothetical protein
MPESTNLNVAPYYDDFDSTENHVKTLFRPGFAIQARELTQLQSTLQNQIEQGFSHIFKDGTVVIPGQVSYLGNKTAPRYVKVQSNFGGESIDISQYLNDDVPVTLTGAISGVKFRIITATPPTETDPATFFGVYTSSNLSGTEAGTFTQDVTTISRSKLDAAGFDSFVIGENLSADVSVQHGTTAYLANTTSLTTAATETIRTTTTANTSIDTPLTGKSVLVKISSGIYFIRGYFVEVADQTIVVEKYNNNASAKIGLQIDETIITPELDLSLLDNATGTSNFAAKGAHRLQLTLTLISKPLSSIDDKNFIELIKVENGIVQKLARSTEYSILEQTLARRTFDESGSYTVRPFTFEMKESVDVSVRETNFDGVYDSGVTTRDGNKASADLLALQVSPGKAYVKGYEIDKIAPSIVDVNKSRDFRTFDSAASAIDLGNYIKVTNLYGTPDVSNISGETTVYKQLDLYDTNIATRGTAVGVHMGVARVRTYQYDSGIAGEQAATYRLYLFDIRMFTRITLSGTPSPTILSAASNGGQRIVGSTSGATGFVFGSGTTGTTLLLTNVTGIFSSGETLALSNSSETGNLIETSGNVDITTVEITPFNFENTRSIHQEDTSSDSGQDFTADVQFVSISSSSSSLVQEGDGNENESVLLEDGGTQSLNPRSTDGTGSLKSVAKLLEPEKNTNIYILPKTPVKTLLTASNDGVSDTQYTFRRQFVATTSSAGAITLGASGGGETFLAHSESDYTVSVLSGIQQGDIISASTGFSGGGTAAVTITNLAGFGASVKLKVMATLLKTNVTPKTKTTKLMKQLKVDTGATDPFGTRPDDRLISLGRADVFAVSAVYEATAASTDAVAPTLSLSTPNGSFIRGEKITGSSSGETGRVINTTTPMSYVSTTTAKDFTTSDTITGASSGATALVSAVTVGDPVISSNFIFDSGQRDNFYDIARIERRRGAPAPTKRLLVIYDYLEHGAGDVFTVDSYSGVAGRMDYVDVSSYNGIRLSNGFDFRPTVENIAGAGTDHTTVDEITAASFDFFHRQYDGAGSSASHCPKPNSLAQADLEYYLSKKAIIVMGSDGVIEVIEGSSDEVTVFPEQPANSMKLGNLLIPAFTYTPNSVTIRREKNQRFTMKDIGKLKNRISNLEYYTHLSLLESDAESFEIQDSNGLNRFKSGFVVDAFQGHRLGDVTHRDYSISIDQENNELRPSTALKNVKLEEFAATDSARTNNNYQKTGDVFTLPYTEIISHQQPYATRTERVTPVLLSNWTGQIELTPSGDDWFETEIAPALIINVEGNYNTVAAGVVNSIGTILNSWSTNWSGGSTDANEGIFDVTYPGMGQENSGPMGGGDTVSYGMAGGMDDGGASFGPGTAGSGQGEFE